MSDSEKAVDTPASKNDSGTYLAGIRESPQEINNTDAGLHDFPDLSNFVNQRTEDDLNKLFASRYTMDDKLYVEVANGFPDPVIVYPWNKKPKRNFDYTGSQQRSWRGDNKRNVGSERQNNWESPSYDHYAAQESRKRRYLTTDPDRLCYPKRNP